MTSDKPSAEDLKLLQDMGMTEVEPGRWTGPRAGRLESTELFGPSTAELDSAMKAGVSANEEDMAEIGGHLGVSMQTLPPGDAAEPLRYLIYAHIADSFTGALESLDPEAVAASADQAMDRHPDLSPPDVLAVGLRRQGIKCRAEHLHPDHGVQPEQQPGFRTALFDVITGEHSWV